MACALLGSAGSFSLAPDTQRRFERSRVSVLGVWGFSHLGFKDLGLWGVEGFRGKKLTSTVTS